MGGWDESGMQDSENQKDLLALEFTLGPGLVSLTPWGAPGGTEA